MLGASNDDGPIRGGGAGDSTRVSPREWFAGLFHTHKDVFSPVLSAGSLLHEIAVDGAYVIESQKVHWLKVHQKQPRADLYQGVVDYLAADADAEANNSIGRRLFYQLLIKDPLAIYLLTTRMQWLSLGSTVAYCYSLPSHVILPGLRLHVSSTLGKPSLIVLT